MKSVIEWAVSLRHTSSDFPVSLRAAIDEHNERIISLVRAEGFKAGQEAMRERAAAFLRNCDWAHDAYAGSKIAVLRDLISEFPIEEPPVDSAA